MAIATTTTRRRPGAPRVNRARPGLFNTKPITLTGVSGLNGQTFSNGVTLPASFVGNCTTCHDSPNAGDHSVKAPLNIGLTEPDVAPYLPVYTLRNVVDAARS